MGIRRILRVGICSLVAGQSIKKIKKKRLKKMEVTWEGRMSRGTGTLVGAVRERFNWLGGSSVRGWPIFTAPGRGVS